MKRTDILVMMGVVLAGCTEVSGDSKTPGVRCIADSECPTQLICRYDVCVSSEVVPRELSFRLVPPNSTTWKPQSVSASTVDVDEPVTIALVPSIRVAGKLLYVNESNQVRPDGPSGVLTFRREGQNQSLEQYRVESDSRYSTFLLPGRYDVSFIPEDSSAPPVGFGTRDFVLDTDPELTVPVRSVSVTGSLRDSPGPGIRAEAVRDASVVAVSRTTGALSSVGTTDAQGFFTFNVLPQADLYDLRVSYETNDYLREITIFQALDCTMAKCTNLLGEDDTFQVSLEATVGDSLQRQVNLVPERTELVPDFSDVVIEMNGTMPWGTARVRRTLDASGSFTARLPDGDYEVVVSTPQSFPLSGKRDSLVFAIDDTAITIGLSPKVSASIEVLDLENLPATDARLEFQRQDASDPVVLTADSEGRVNVLLEDAPHRIVITAMQNGVGRGVVEWSPSMPTMSVQLPAAAVLTGSVLGAPTDASNKEWQAVEDVAVQVLENYDGSQVTVGETTTRADGTFRVIIPASVR